MILHRARRLADRPRRITQCKGNAPAQRAKGRWFTSDRAAAEAHAATLEGPAEIVQVEVPERLLAFWSVAAVPTTPCGLQPGLHSTNPAADYLLPMFVALEAAVPATGRVRDVIDVRTPEAAAATLSATRHMTRFALAA